MGRIRTVKPELFLHEELFEAEKSSGLPLRLAFMGLFTVADRDGRFRWKPKQIKLAVMPWDRVDFESVLGALCQAGFVLKYEVGTQGYGCIPSWGKHQVINHREAPSACPGVPGGKGIGREGKGIGKGKGREVEGKARADDDTPLELAELEAMRQVRVREQAEMERKVIGSTIDGELARGLGRVGSR